MLLNFSTIKLCTPAPISHHARNYVTPLEWDILLHLSGGVFTKIVWNSPWEIFLFSPFIYIHMDWWFVCFFNRFWILIQYNFMLLLNVYQLWPLAISSASSWVLLIHPHHCKQTWFWLFVFLCAFPYFLALQDAPGSFCVFPAPGLGSAPPQGALVHFIGTWWWWCSVAWSCLTLCNPMDCSTQSWTRLGDWAATWFALLGRGVRNQQMGSRCAHCCWGVTASRPS